MQRQTPRSKNLLLLVGAILFAGWEVGLAQSQVARQTNQVERNANASKSSQVLNPTSAVPRTPGLRMRSVTAAQRKAAAARAAARRSAAAAHAKASSLVAPPQNAPRAAAAPGKSGLPMPDYFGTIPNYANSPAPTVTVDPITGLTTVSGGIRKFVDTLPGLGPANANSLGQYIPIAVPITNPDGTPKYANTDYYEIGVVDYTQRMHSDLPATTRLRGYKDLNPVADQQAHYLGPFIIAKKDRPVRILFENQLPTGALGNLFLPVDTTIMGAGLGPDGVRSYTQNRATLHLHGGNTPWISDGTPHQWTVPAGENTPYKKGVSTRDVPDMPASGDGAMTYYYPNQQSSRLIWYHDHSYGLTRLNVYAGEAAGYLLTDQVEDGLIDSGTIPGAGEGVYRYGIPLIIQDKTFVPGPAALAAEDPTWDTSNWGGTGNLWFPHVYMPNQNPSDEMGINAMGRWDYGPWFWPPYTNLTHQPIAGTGSNGCPVGVTCPATPNPTIVPEAFMDTAMVNGTAYPVLTVARKAYRFRILNASNDRYLNLQLYYADPARPTEIAMVPAVANAVSNWPATWPTDGRDGGVPDPNTAGPAMVQIGNEAGFLPAPVVLPNTPIGYNYNRRDIVVLNVTNHTLFLGPAERADVVVDFSQAPDGAKIILYNDAPAPVPAFDPRIDYYTGDPDFSDTGGAPTTLDGYGPNTRTIMEFQISGGSAAGAFNLAALQAAFTSTSTTTGAFAGSQLPPHVPEADYGAAFNATYSNKYVKIQDTAITYTPAGSSTPTTLPLQPKAIQELFDPEYGRMNSTLGVELPNTNITIQTTIPYFYIDPPTEIFKSGETQVWKITHNGVDTHAIHFHLFDVQLLNRVGWDGAVRPPDPNELGWKDTVRMNPLEDAIVALRPMKQSLPWPIPDSIRLLDPAMPEGSTMGFTNVDPLGNPIQVVNVLTNFGWEYVWHCHLLGHEENDMMRPMILQIPPEAPSNLTGVSTSKPSLRIQLTWTDNSASATGFTVQVALNPGFTQGLRQFSVGPSTGTGASVTYTDTSVSGNQTYYYRVLAFSPNGASAWSNTTQVGLAPHATILPTTIAFGNQSLNTNSSAQSVTLSNTGTGQLANIKFSFSGTNAADFTKTTTCGSTLAAGASCAILVTFRPAALGARVASLVVATNDPVNPQLSAALSGTGVASVPIPQAPTNLTATAAGTSQIILRWQDRSTNESGFYLERSTDQINWFRIATLAANATTYTNVGLNRRTTYWYRIQAYNASGASTFSNTASATTQ